MAGSFAGRTARPGKSQICRTAGFLRVWRPTGRVRSKSWRRATRSCRPPARPGSTCRRRRRSSTRLATATNARCAWLRMRRSKLARVVSVVTAVLDPGLIVLAGGIGRNTDLLAGPIRRELAETIPLVPDIVGGHLGDDAVLVGAIATAMDTAWDLVFDRRVLGRVASEGLTSPPAMRRQKVSDGSHHQSGTSRNAA